MKTLLTLIVMWWISGAVYAQHGDHHHHDHTAMQASEQIPEQSLYHLRGEWTSHRGEQFLLSEFSGSPLVIVMFYGNCTDVCPILIQDAWRLYSSVGENMREEVNVLAVTFDTENDTPESLMEYARYEQLNIDGWHFVTASPATVRQLATALGVEYRKRSDGMYDHSNLVTVVGPDGVVGARVEGLGRPMEVAARVLEEFITEKQLP
ncbi:MAG: SCO family protein [Balneolaceae bacterium]